MFSDYRVVLPRPLETSTFPPYLEGLLFRTGNIKLCGFFRVKVIVMSSLLPEEPRRERSSSKDEGFSVLYYPYENLPSHNKWESSRLIIVQTLSPTSPRISFTLYSLLVDDVKFMWKHTSLSSSVLSWPTTEISMLWISLFSISVLSIKHEFPGLPLLLLGYPDWGSAYSTHFPTPWLPPMMPLSPKVLTRVRTDSPSLQLYPSPIRWHRRHPSRPPSVSSSHPTTPDSSSRERPTLPFQSPVSRGPWSIQTSTGYPLPPNYLSHSIDVPTPSDDTPRPVFQVCSRRYGCHPTPNGVSPTRIQSQGGVFGNSKVHWESFIKGVCSLCCDTLYLSSLL